jgi:hypothetical protein
MEFVCDKIGAGHVAWMRQYGILSTCGLNTSWNKPAPESSKWEVKPSVNSMMSLGCIYVGIMRNYMQMLDNIARHEI